MNIPTMEEAQEKPRKSWLAPPRNDKVDYAGGQRFDVNLSDLYVLHYVNECQIDQYIMITTNLLASIKRPFTYAMLYI